MTLNTYNDINFIDFGSVLGRFWGNFHTESKYLMYQNQQKLKEINLQPRLKNRMIFCVSNEVGLRKSTFFPSENLSIDTRVWTKCRGNQITIIGFNVIKGVINS